MSWKTFLFAVSLVMLISTEAANAMTPYPGGKKAAIALTFDDATLDQYEAALPILEKHGVRKAPTVI